MSERDEKDLVKALANANAAVKLAAAQWKYHDEILFNPTVTKERKLFLLGYIRKRNSKTGECWASHQTLAAAMSSRDRQAAKRMSAQLIQEGVLVTVTERQGQTRITRLNEDKIAEIRAAGSLATRVHEPGSPTTRVNRDPGLRQPGPRVTNDSPPGSPETPNPFIDPSNDPSKGEAPTQDNAMAPPSPWIQSGPFQKWVHRGTDSTGPSPIAGVPSHQNTDEGSNSDLVGRDSQGNVIPYRVDKGEGERKRRGAGGPLKMDTVTGKLEFDPIAGAELKASLQRDFPGVPLDELLNKAAPRCAKEPPSRWPAILREKAEYVRSDARRNPRRGPYSKSI